MRNVIDSSGFCLPVTALQSLSLGQRRLLLIGQGPFLHVSDIRTDRRLLSVRIFEPQVVHGIDVGTLCSRIDTPDFVPIAIFGGSAVALARLEGVQNASGSNSVELRNVAVGHTSDWILKARYQLSGPSEFSFVLLTANNALWTASHFASRYCSLRIEQSTGGPKSFLYSGDICRLSTDKFLIVGGSIFGQVLVWSCERTHPGSAWQSRTTHRFEAHGGSVFGVCFSGELSVRSEIVRLVASCSEDRTICVWDVSDHEHMGDDVAESDMKETAFTGFGHQRKNNGERLAIASGHMSRIWDVEFLPSSTAGTSTRVHIISRGEDANCKLWSLAFANSELQNADSARLELLSSDHHHSGKNILAWTTIKAFSAFIIVTGGADGRVLKRKLQLSTDAGCLTFSRSFGTLPVDLSSIALKNYLLLDPVTVIAQTTSGKLLRCRVSRDSSQTWQVDSSSCATSPVSRLCSNSVDGIVVFATKEGICISPPDKTPSFLPLQFKQSISWMSIVSVDRPTPQRLEIKILITYPPPEPSWLLYLDPAKIDEAPGMLILRLPQGFTVTCACYSGTRDLLFLGSRGGSIATYRLSFTTYSPPSLVSIRQSHGSDSVTSLHIIETNEAHRLHVLSTGKDGTFSMLEVKIGDDSNQLFFRTVFKSSPPFTMNLEGATLSLLPQSQQVDLVVFGFRSTEFVVWSHTKQSQLFAVDCGGAHRSWAYSFGHGNPAEHAFVWTKAGAFNYQRSYDNAPAYVQDGGHGREIKALAVSHSFPNMRWDEPAMIATGAEDTTIRLFSVLSRHALLEERTCVLKGLGILSDHTTGILHLAFSHCGNYLFSSAGHGQFYTWRVNLGAPVVGLGVLLLDQMPQANDDTDARIMCFDVIPGDPIHIIAAYSNGKLRGVEYHPGSSPGQGNFVSRTEFVYGAFCLMQVQLHALSETQLTVLAAGTDGFLNWASLENLSSLKGNRKHSVHQSSILAMDHVALSSTCSLIVTGGDDHALGLTLLNSDAKGSSADNAARANTALVPKSHAAALTALQIVSHKQHRRGHYLVLISVGNDQRVKVWGITISAGLSGISLHDVKISRLHECWTSVADASNIRLLRPMRRGERNGAQEGQVVVVGVGIEILNVRLEGEAFNLLELPPKP